MQNRAQMKESKCAKNILKCANEKSQFFKTKLCFQSPKTTILITKIHILAIDNVIFAFDDHHFFKNENVDLGDWKCRFDINQCISNHVYL